MNFWYDPVRDLLSAWDNLHKITLIGPTSGIPGIFYGPYWIWILSVGVWFSKNPRFTYLLVATFPFCILFPLVLLKFSRIFKISTIILLWFFFICSDGWGYAVSLWNLNLSTLFLLVLAYLAMTTDFSKSGTKLWVKSILIGLIAGLIFNFNMALGSAVITGAFIFMLIQYFLIINKQKKHLKNLGQGLLILLSYIIGLILIFLPFFFFELRHGFQQIRVFIKALTTLGAIVNIRVLDQKEILSIFFGRFGYILHTNWWGVYLLEIFAVLIFLWLVYKKKIKLNVEERRLIFFLLLLSGAILFIYLTAKNPIWSYHFIGTEVIFLLLIGLIVDKINIFKLILFIYVVYLVFGMVMVVNRSFHTNLLLSSSLYTKEHIVDIINSNANNKEYTVFAYSSSIYTYDYSYLFRWKYKKDLPFDPGQIKMGAKLVYLIIPNDPKVIREDFINYRTRNIFKS
ncbi:MAG: hypothetical protein M1326_06530, partial [Cyanobacteria bacterium]|nr:hypothetical protein [Cyanobacteriota bacterium]